MALVLQFFQLISIEFSSVNNIQYYLFKSWNIRLYIKRMKFIVHNIIYRSLYSRRGSRFLYTAKQIMCWY